MDIKLVNQPPNSPDTNINDLAFFRSISCLQHKIGAGTNKGTLIASVNQAFDQYEWRKLRNSWLTLQCCYTSIIESYGSNHYKIEHMNKAKLEREGKLPSAIVVTDWASQFYPESDNEMEDDTDDSFSLITQP